MLMLRVRATLTRTAANGATQADDEEAAALELKKKRTFRKFSYRGIDLDNLLDLSPEQLIDLVHARARRRMGRGLTKKGMALLKKVRIGLSCQSCLSQY